MFEIFFLSSHNKFDFSSFKLIYKFRMDEILHSHKISTTQLEQGYFSLNFIEAKPSSLRFSIFWNFCYLINYVQTRLLGVYIYTDIFLYNSLLMHSHSYGFD